MSILVYRALQGMFAVMSIHTIVVLTLWAVHGMDYAWQIAVLSMAITAVNGLYLYFFRPVKAVAPEAEARVERRKSPKDHEWEIVFIDPNEGGVIGMHTVAWSLSYGAALQKLNSLRCMSKYQHGELRMQVQTLPF